MKIRNCQINISNFNIENSLLLYSYLFEKYVDLFKYIAIKILAKMRDRLLLIAVARDIRDEIGPM